MAANHTTFKDSARNAENVRVAGEVVAGRNSRQAPEFGNPGTAGTRDQKRALYYSRVATHAVADALWAMEQMRRKPGGALWITAPVHVVCWAVAQAFVAAHGVTSRD